MQGVSELAKETSGYCNFTVNRKSVPTLNEQHKSSETVSFMSWIYSTLSDI